MPLNGATFQISLDQADLDIAISLATLAVESGVQVIEAGTGLIMNEGAKSVLPRLRRLFPGNRLVADIKCTDGGAFEAGQMFDLGAYAVTVMSSASDATIRLAVNEARNHAGCAVMVDTMGSGGADGSNTQGHVDAAMRARDLGAQYAVVHLGFDERGADQRMVDQNLLLKWADAVANADLGIAIQVVGGLTLAQAALLPRMGVHDIVISMNLGSRPVGNMRYDEITGFTVNLDDPADRQAVKSQLSRFIQTVNGG